MKLIQILFYVILLMVLIPVLTIYLFESQTTGGDHHLLAIRSANTALPIETQLQNRLIQLSDRLKHSLMLSTNRKRDIHSLKQDITRLRDLIKLSIVTNTARNHHPNTSQDSLIVQSLENAVRTSGSSDVLQLPSIHHFLPHLLPSSDSLKPAFRIAKNEERSSVTMVFGVPTVRRDVESYLVATLHNLIDNLSVDERQEAIIVVFIAETDLDYVTKTANELESQFGEHMDSGLLEVISPPASYYPNMSTITQTLGDPIDRVRWRSKQNLDFGYLMMYCQPKATYYVQLEDDILTKPSYLTKMKNFAVKASLEKKSWLILDFCSLGFIGKMFKSVDLSMFIIFFVIFHNDKPVDWLLEHLIQTKLCRFDRDLKDCKRQKELVWLHHKPSLFQHIGTHSSLKGKVQKLRDRAFGKLSLYYSHKDNPMAVVSTTLKPYKSHTIEGCYFGETYFWGMTPKTGDNITFTFNPPIPLERYFIRTGNSEHPEDKLTDGSVEILPLNRVTRIPSHLSVTSDGYFVIGGFKIMKGMANGFVPHVLSPVKQLRISITADSDRWLIINEILIKTFKEETDILTN